MIEGIPLKGILGDCEYSLKGDTVCVIVNTPLKGIVGDCGYSLKWGTG